MREHDSPSQAGPEPSGLWGRAFRPFFLGAAVQAALAVPFWVAIWLGWTGGLPGWLPPFGWHAHEMIFGFAAAAIAGFLLTASPVWSGGPALDGRPLALLFGLWVAGRLVFAGVGFVPPWLMAVVDLAFLPGVAWAAMRTLRGSGQWHNHALVAIVLLLALANAAMHAEELGLISGMSSRAPRVAIQGVLILLVVLTGRVTPVFTRNAFRRDGIEHTVWTAPRTNALAITALCGLVLAEAILPRSVATGVLAAVAGLLAAGRMVGWQSVHTRSDPLLWSLHLGAVWVPIGLGLVAAGDLGAPIPFSAGLHALTAGAIGATILAIATRVGLGHTGRPLQLPPGIVWCAVLVNVAALVRVGASALTDAAYRGALIVSAVAWSLAFTLFLIRYLPILTQPRPDGRPG